MNPVVADRVELRGHGDLQQMQQLMNDAVEQYIQQNAQGASVEFQQALRERSANVLSVIQQFVVVDEKYDNGMTPTAALQSPMLKPLSPPPVDTEVKQLEKEVEEASKRVTELRDSMQAQLQETLTSKLAQCRPSQEVQPPEPTAHMEGGTAPGEDTMSPGAGDLHTRLDETAAKLPTLRARLEQATSRLQRVVEAVSTDNQRPPPNTVERVVLGKTPGPAAGITAALAVEEALESGLVATRGKRVDGEVEPVPCNIPAEDEQIEEDKPAAAADVDGEITEAVQEQE